VQVPGKTEEETFHLDPPPNWEEYKAYLEDRGPPPRPLVLPSKLMLQEEADERWEQRSQVTWSKYHCPSCKERIMIRQLVCTKCGLDFRTGIVLGQRMKVNEKGMQYLAAISWVREAREEHEREEASRPVAPRKRKRRLR
jgi:ribosomal protein L37AE/L43A